MEEFGFLAILLSLLWTMLGLAISNIEIPGKGHSFSEEGREFDASRVTHISFKRFTGG
jgi:hypothetical protein